MYVDKEKEREYRKAYYKKNRVKVDKANLKWKANNKDRVKELDREYRKRDDARRLYHSSKRRSKSKGIEFSIELEDIVIPEVCPYFKTKFIYGDRDLTMSLDRIDNKKGYVKGNIEVISYIANRMKSSASIENLILFAEEVLCKFKTGVSASKGECSSCH